MKKDSRGSLRLASDLHREIKIHSAQTGVAMNDLIAEAWGCYVASLTQNKSPEIVAKQNNVALQLQSPDERFGKLGQGVGRDCLYLLSAVLESRNQIAIRAIMSNLEAFAAMVSAIPEARIEESAAIIDECSRKFHELSASLLDPGQHTEVGEAVGAPGSGSEDERPAPRRRRRA